MPLRESFCCWPLARQVHRIIAASSTFWSRTAQAKMYSLHYFFIAVLLTLALQYRAAYERGDKQASTRWLVALAITLGLSFTNHLMTILLFLPIALLLIGGAQPGYRKHIVRSWAYLVPAFLAPLLLYAYMPLRASQDPVMNWGSTNTWEISGAISRAGSSDLICSGILAKPAGQLRLSSPDMLLSSGD